MRRSSARWRSSPATCARSGVPPRWPEPSGRFDEAIALGQRAAELEPTNAQIYYNLCILQRKGGQLDAALLSGRRALELDPKLAYAQFQLGAIHLIKGNIDDAFREFGQETG